MAKGGAYEREVCKLLSEWWSPGNDDIFWRSSQSGGRATVRRRKGKGTRGHCGDICATDSTGEPFVRLITTEIKKGYNKASIFDLLDKKGKSGKTYPDWFKQARSASSNADTPYWIIVHRRDHRHAIVVLPNPLLTALIGLGCMLDWTERLVLSDYTALRLDDFFAAVDPQDIKLLLRSK